MMKVYRASAGSGKTFQLTREYIRLLYLSNHNHAHRNILAVTFTNKATEEMKFRILEELNQLAHTQHSPYRADLMKQLGQTSTEINAKAKELLVQILHNYSAFSISTIDTFFQQIIRAFAREMGVNSNYTLDLKRDEALEQSIDALFAQLTEEDNDMLFSWLTRFVEESIEQAGQWNVRNQIVKLGKEIFQENYQHKAQEIHKRLHDKTFLKSYKNDLHLLKQQFVQKVEQSAHLALECIRLNGLQVDDFKGGSRSSMKQLEKLLKGEYGVTDTFFHMIDDVNECYSKNSPKTSEIIHAYHSGLQTQLLRLKKLLQEDIILFNSVKVIEKHLNTFGIMSDLAMQIRKLTIDQQTLLISEANLLLNKIIDESDSPFIYEKTGTFIHHYMIDEFQDTSVLQWKNFLPLLKNSVSSGFFNLVVGDVKQSIYRWRNSDWKLLESQIYTDFNKESLTQVSLDTNYRSDKNIVQFNNEFFTLAASLLQNNLTEQLQSGLPNQELIRALNAKITDAYADIKQCASDKAGEGRVCVVFIEQTNDQGEHWKQLSLNQLPKQLEELQLRGYMPADIAILVRKNTEIPLVVDSLLQYKNSDQSRTDCSYDIMGTEGLLLSASPTIRWIIGLMHLMLQPQNTMHQLVVGYEYARGRLAMTESEALKRCFDVLKNTSDITTLFHSHETALFHEIKSASLHEMIVAIIDGFQLATWSNEILFLEAFHDQVHSYCTTESSDINAFLQWWQSTGQQQSITVPESERAFKIMTIHKSKGLDFKVVIIPFCDWANDSNMRNFLWCSTDHEPFNRIPFLPVEYTSLLGKTVFAAQYYNEMMHYFMDNLNLAYVAFTRAKHELICFCPKPKVKDKESKLKVNSLSKTLFQCLSASNSAWLTTHYNPETSIFEIGEKLVVSTSNRNNNAKITPFTNFPLQLPGSRLSVKHQIGSLNRIHLPIHEKPMDYGNLMHDLLHRITDIDDVTRVLARLELEGRITSSESRSIQAEMEHFFTLPEVAIWFNKGVRVLSEATILTSEGVNYRPDRIMIEGNQATVVDFKFGENEMVSHVRQVKKYSTLLQLMGYTTKAYLCYVKLRKVQLIT